MYFVARQLLSPSGDLPYSPRVAGTLPTSLGTQGRQLSSKATSGRRAGLLSRTPKAPSCVTFMTQSVGHVSLIRRVT